MDKDKHERTCSVQVKKKHTYTLLYYTQIIGQGLWSTTGPTHPLTKLI